MQGPHNFAAEFGTTALAEADLLPSDRCPSLHTLVLALKVGVFTAKGFSEDKHPDDSGWRRCAAILQMLLALTEGAPSLAKLQLVLRANDFIHIGVSVRTQLWQALDRMPCLASLTLCLEFDEHEADMRAGEQIAALLDGMDARLPAVTDLCVHTVRATRTWTMPWQLQVATDMCTTFVGKIAVPCFGGGVWGVAVGVLLFVCYLTRQYCSRFCQVPVDSRLLRALKDFGEFDGVGCQQTTKKPMLLVTGYCSLL